MKIAMFLDYKLTDIYSKGFLRQLHYLFTLDMCERQLKHQDTQGYYRQDVVWGGVGQGV